MNELEIKILNIDVELMKQKLESIGAENKGETIQKIYTYDCYDPIIMYELAIKDYKITKSKNSLKKIINILEQLKPVISEQDKNKIKEISNYEYLDLYIKNNLDNINLNILLNKDIKKIIKNTKSKFFKWIRLRQNKGKVELTIKYIYNVNKDYNIDDVKEIEINVSNFETANKLIEEMGYYHKKLVEKKRTSYIIGDTKIEIDEWPLIPPYIEIEGKDEKTIYEIAQALGYKKEETRIMNTEDVYLENNLDLTSYEILTFERSVKINERLV